MARAKRKVQKRRVQTIVHSWVESSDMWTRIVNSRGESAPVHRLKATNVNVDGSEIACYAEHDIALRGLMRLHMHTVRR